MNTNFYAILQGALVATAVAATSCGGNTTNTADSGAEAGCPAPADAGCPARADAGCPARADAGCPARADAGCPAPADAGCPARADAGCPAPADAGPAAELPANPMMYAAWLGTDAYRTWRCDAMPQAPFPDSPHGRNIICINPTLAGARGGMGQWPVGSAAVKLTFNAMGQEGPRFLDVRVGPEAGGAGWYFLRRNPDGATPIAGRGSEMAPGMACVGCHSAGGRDLVRRTP